MILYEWLGKEGDVQPFQTSSTGTGQSGSISSTSTATQLLTNAKAMSWTQNTSSGDGTMRGNLWLPLPVGITRVRAQCVLRSNNAEVDVDHIRFGCTHYDGSYHRTYNMQLTSEYNVTNKVTYGSTGAAQTDTGFTWPNLAAAYSDTWMTLGFDISLTNNKMTAVRFNENSLAVDAIWDAGAISLAPRINWQIELAGDDTSSAIYVDSMKLEGFTV